MAGVETARAARIVVALLVLAATVFLVISLDWHTNTIFWGYILSGALGAATGASEIVSRYRDEPLRATVNKYGLGYLTANAGLSVAAYALLGRYSEQIAPAATGDWLIRAFFAGFGAMVIMRSKLFIFKSDDGKEYPIGPAIVMESFLRMLDRKIDRHRASRRQARVFTSMQDVVDFDGAANYLEVSLLSFQNLSQEEKAQIAEVVKQYKASPWPPALKSAALGLAFLTIAGEENYDQVIASLKQYLSPGGDPPPGP